MRIPKITKIFSFIFLSFPVMVFSQSSQININNDTVYVGNNVNPRFAQIRLESSEDLQLNFNPISESQFIHFKKISSLDIDTSCNGISSGKGFFQLTAADTTFIFGCEYYKNCQRYLGYYPVLDSYLIGVSGNEVSYNFLIEKSTSKGLELPLPYETGVSNPIISSDGNSLLFYENVVYTSSEPYGELSSIVLLDISKMNELQDLHLNSYKSYYSSKWVIDDLVWIDNENMAIKTVDSNDGIDGLEKYKYLKAQIKQN